MAEVSETEGWGSGQIPEEASEEAPDEVSKEAPLVEEVPGEVPGEAPLSAEEERVWREKLQERLRAASFKAEALALENDALRRRLSSPRPESLQPRRDSSRIAAWRGGQQAGSQPSSARASIAVPPASQAVEEAEAEAEAAAGAEAEAEVEAEAEAEAELAARDAARQLEVAASFAATSGSRPRPRGRRGTAVLRREFVSSCPEGPGSPVPAAPVRSQMLLDIQRVRETAEARTFVDPRLAHQERLQAEKATAGAGTPAALALAIEKRRLAVEAQMRALDEGLDAGIMSPRRAREAELEAERKKKFTERQAKRQHRRRSQDDQAANH